MMEQERSMIQEHNIGNAERLNMSIAVKKKKKSNEHINIACWIRQAKQRAQTLGDLKVSI